MSRSEPKVRLPRAPGLDMLVYDWAELAEKYERIETRVYVDAVNAFQRYLAASGANFAGDLLIIDGATYQQVPVPPAADRELRFLVVPILRADPTLVTCFVDINHFGVIRRVSVKWPPELQKYEAILEFVNQRIRHSYGALKEAFVQAHCRLDSSLYDGLYEILNVEIGRDESREHLLKQTWFNITDVTTSNFRYYFTRPRLEALVTALIKKQSLSFSPFELALCLTSDEALDNFWKRRKTSNLQCPSGSRAFP